MHLFIYGLILGWGAAIPIGPINLEMMRRNLHYGTLYGIALGVGACSADVTYVVLLCLGALALLTHPMMLNIIGILGSLLLCWFGYKAFFLAAKEDKTKKIKQSKIKNIIEGFILTLINPYTILFWGSVSSQLLLVTQGSTQWTVLAATGVIIGTFSWVLCFNVLLKFTRHKLSDNITHWLNRAGGLVLWGFAIFGFYQQTLIRF